MLYLLGTAVALGLLGPPGGGSGAVRWDAPPSCPGAADVERYAALLEPTKGAAPGMLRGSVTRDAAMWRLELTVRTDGHEAHRVYNARRCEELARTAGLWLALAANPKGDGERPPEATPAVPYQRPDGGVPPPPLVAPTPRAQTPRPRVVPKPRAPRATQRGAATIPPQPRDAEVPAADRKLPSSWVLALDASFGGAFRVVPAAAFAGGVHASLTRKHLRIEVGGYGVATQRESVPDPGSLRGVDVSLAAASLGAGVQFRWPGALVAGIAGVEAGALRGRPVRLERGATVRLPWLAGFASAVAGWRFSTQVALVARADVTVLPRPPGFEVDPVGIVFRPPALGARLGAGFQLEFE